MKGLINKLIALTLAIAMQLPTVNMSMAQSSPESTPDIRSPVIELDVIAESTADNAQLFTAKVIEDKLLKDVLLYHRRAGQQPFTPTAMVQTGDSNSFSVSLATDPTDLRAIEYYIQARDEGGNRTVEGFAFDPYTRFLTPSKQVADTTVTPVVVAKSEPAVSEATGKIRWWHIVAGVLVVGAVSSLSSSGGSADNSAGGETVPLTLNITGP